MRENGLHASAYVAVADLHPQLADVMLEALADEGVAAYASPPSSGRELAMPTQFPTGPVDRLWVDREATATARRVLDERLPELRAELERAHAEAGNGRTRQGDDAESTPGGVLVDDATWADIIAAYRADSAGGHSWPDAEDVRADDGSGQGAGKSPPRRADAEEWPEQRRPTPREPDDPADHFQPPLPPPLPTADSTTRLAWAGVVGGPVLLLLSVMLDWDLASWAQVFAVAAMVGGFVTLVARMRDGGDDVAGDSGAVV